MPIAGRATLSGRCICERMRAKQPTATDLDRSQPRLGQLELLVTGPQLFIFGCAHAGSACQQCSVLG
eukprot:3078986-Rhodomonas_salina.5